MSTEVIPLTDEAVKEFAATLNTIPPREEQCLTCKGPLGDVILSYKGKIQNFGRYFQIVSCAMVSHFLLETILTLRLSSVSRAHPPQNTCASMAFQPQRMLFLKTSECGLQSTTRSNPCPPLSFVFAPSRLTRTALNSLASANRAACEPNSRRLIDARRISSRPLLCRARKPRPRARHYLSQLRLRRPLQAPRRL